MRVRDLVTSSLDALGLLAVATGAGAGAAQWVGWFGAAVGGLVLIGGSLLMHRAGGDAK